MGPETENAILSKVESSLANVEDRIKAETCVVENLPASKEKKMLDDLTTLEGLYELRSTLREIRDLLVPSTGNGGAGDGSWTYVELSAASVTNGTAVFKVISG